MQFFGIAANAGGTDDHAHVVGNGQCVQGFLQRGAVVAFNPARNATGGRAVRHQHHVTASQRDKRGQGSALVAAFFLVDLDDDFLAFAQDFLHAGLVGVDAGNKVVAGDLLQRQEAVAFSAVIDERGFEGRFEPYDPTLVDVAFFLFFRGLFDIDVVKGLAIDDCHAQFFCLRGVDQHTLHGGFLTRSTARNAGGPRPCKQPEAHAHSGLPGTSSATKTGITDPRERLIVCFIKGPEGRRASFGMARVVSTRRYPSAFETG